VLLPRGNLLQIPPVTLTSYLYTSIQALSLPCHRQCLSTNHPAGLQQFSPCLPTSVSPRSSDIFQILTLSSDI
jgi:hypothetical protein